MEDLNRLGDQPPGTDDPAILAYACFQWNIHKGPNLTAIDPKSAVLCRLTLGIFERHAFVNPD